MKFECDLEKNAEVACPAYLRVGISAKTPHLIIFSEDVEGVIIVYLNISDAKNFVTEVLKKIAKIEKHEQ